MYKIAICLVFLVLSCSPEKRISYSYNEIETPLHFRYPLGEIFVDEIQEGSYLDDGKYLFRDAERRVEELRGLYYSFKNNGALLRGVRHNLIILDTVINQEILHLSILMEKSNPDRFGTLHITFPSDKPQLFMVNGNELKVTHIEVDARNAITLDVVSIPEIQLGDGTTIRLAAEFTTLEKAWSSIIFHRSKDIEFLALSEKFVFSYFILNNPNWEGEKYSGSFDVNPDWGGLKRIVRETEIRHIELQKRFFDVKILSAAILDKNKTQIEVFPFMNGTTYLVEITIDNQNADDEEFSPSMQDFAFYLSANGSSGFQLNREPYSSSDAYSNVPIPPGRSTHTFYTTLHNNEEFSSIRYLGTDYPIENR